MAERLGRGEHIAGGTSARGDRDRPAARVEHHDDGERLGAGTREGVRGQAELVADVALISDTGMWDGLTFASGPVTL